MFQSPYSFVKQGKPKDGRIYTPPELSQFLYKLIEPVLLKVNTLLDPAIGTGSLVKPWKDAYTIGVDVWGDSIYVCDEFVESRFELLEADSFSRVPDLILCNPPFSGGMTQMMYPEIFLRRFVDLYGPSVPVALFVPHGFRMNQRRKSKRRTWMSNSGMEITSIITLTIDTFECQVLSEILLFNIPCVAPHYWW